MCHEKMRELICSSVVYVWPENSYPRLQLRIVSLDFVSSILREGWNGQFFVSYRSFTRFSICYPSLGASVTLIAAHVLCHQMDTLCQNNAIFGYMRLQNHQNLIKKLTSRRSKYVATSPASSPDSLALKRSLKTGFMLWRLRTTYASSWRLHVFLISLDMKHKRFRTSQQ